MAATFDATASVVRRHWDSSAAAEDALRRVYVEHYDRLVGFFVRRTQDRPLAEDLAHDAIVRFANAAERFDWSRPAWPYLKMTASNLLIDHLRRQGLVVVAEDEEDEAFDRVDPIQDLDDQVALGTLLDDAMATLSDRQRVAVELRCRRGWSVSDAAAFMGIESGAFNQLVYRARQNLRAVLEEAGARVAGMVVPVLVAARARLRSVSERVREAVPTPVSAAGAETMASVVIATTVGVVVAVGGVPSEAGADERRPSASAVVVREVVAEPAVQRLPSDVVALAQPTAPSPQDQAAATAPEASSSAEPPEPTVIEAPEAVPDSEGRVTVGEDEDDYFVVNREISAETDVEEVHWGGEGIAVECDTDVGRVLCSENAKQE